MGTLTDEDLDAVEQLMKQRRHVKLPREKWSSAMLKAMLDKVGPLVQEVRELRKQRDILKLTLDVELESLMLRAVNGVMADAKAAIKDQARNIR